MEFKRIISVVLVVLIALTCISGCTGCTRNVNVKLTIKNNTTPTINTAVTPTVNTQTTVQTTESSTQPVTPTETPNEPSNTPTAPSVTPTVPENTTPQYKKMYAIGFPLVKDSPDILGGVVSLLKCGEEVQKISTDGCYTKILYNNKEVYVLSICLSEKEPSILSLIGDLL